MISHSKHTSAWLNLTIDSVWLNLTMETEPKRSKPFSDELLHQIHTKAKSTLAPMSEVEEVPAKRSKYVTDEIAKNIHNYLETNLGLEFIHFMKHCKVVLGGSTIIQAVLNEDWPFSDIDLFINDSQMTAYRRKLSAKDEERHSNLIYHVQDILNIHAMKMNTVPVTFEIKPFPSYLESNTIPAVKTIDFMLNNKKIQLTITNYHSSEEDNITHYLEKSAFEFSPGRGHIKHYLENSDFDICRNIYYYNGDNPTVIITDEESIRNRTFSFKVNRNIGKVLERAMKYSSRGFKIKQIIPELILCFTDATFKGFKNFLESHIIMLNAEQIEIFGLCPPTFDPAVHDNDYDPVYYNRYNYEKYQDQLLELVKTIVNNYYIF